MSRALPRDLKKWETNSEPLSEVMWEGTLCLEKTWRRKSLANSGEVIVSSVGMKIHCLERQSRTTRIAVCPEEAGSCLMKSMEMEFHGFKEMGSCFRSPYGLCLGIFAHTQVVHEEICILFNECPYSWPGVFMVYEFQGPVLSKMSGEGVIVLMMKNMKTEVIGVRDIDTVV